MKSGRPNPEDDPFDDVDETLETSFGSYDVYEGVVERVVCGREGAGLDKKGMPAFRMKDVDEELDGLYGVHCGDADEWLPILARDGYCDGDAYVYEIDIAEAVDDGITFRIMEDPHVVDRSDAPDSQIVFSRLKVIPPKYIKLVRVVPAAEVGALGDEDEDEDEPF